MKLVRSHVLFGIDADSLLAGAKQHFVYLLCAEMTRGALLQKLQNTNARCRGLQPGIVQILAFFSFSQ